MTAKNLSVKNNIQSRYLYNNLNKKLSKRFKKIIDIVHNEINSDNKTLNILNKNFKFNFKLKDLEKFKKFKTIVIIGMGGSSLGAEAINSFFQDKIKKKFYFLNNLNQDKLTLIKKKDHKKILFLVISKSGNTIETLSNFLALNILKKNAKNIILISERRKNLLHDIAKKFGLFYIEHKNFIGGRFSVLSEVGLVPAYLMGLDIKKIRSKIRDFTYGKRGTYLRDSSIKLTNLFFSKKIDDLIFLNYAPKLEKFLYWCQQLIAESLGKNKKGFLPVISNVPKDHHSLLQLYLDGPRNKLFHIFSAHENPKDRITLKKNLKIKTYLNKKSLSLVKNAQKNALIETLKKNHIPFREFKIKNINEEVLGELFSYFILETIIIGKLANINPFSQPAVEQVKINTKRLLT